MGKGGGGVLKEVIGKTEAEIFKKIVICTNKN